MNKRYQIFDVMNSFSRFTTPSSSNFFRTFPICRLTIFFFNIHRKHRKNRIQMDLKTIYNKITSSVLHNLELVKNIHNTMCASVIPKDKWWTLVRLHTTANPIRTIIPNDTLFYKLFCS